MRNNILPIFITKEEKEVFIEALRTGKIQRILELIVNNKDIISYQDEDGNNIFHRMLMDRHPPESILLFLNNITPDQKNSILQNRNNQNETPEDILIGLCKDSDYIAHCNINALFFLISSCLSINSIESLYQLSITDNLRIQSIIHSNDENFYTNLNSYLSTEFSNILDSHIADTSNQNTHLDKLRKLTVIVSKVNGFEDKSIADKITDFMEPYNAQFNFDKLFRALLIDNPFMGNQSIKKDAPFNFFISVYEILSKDFINKNPMLKHANLLLNKYKPGRDLEDKFLLNLAEVASNNLLPEVFEFLANKLENDNRQNSDISLAIAAQNTNPAPLEEILKNKKEQDGFNINRSLKPEDITPLDYSIQSLGCLNNIYSLMDFGAMLDIDSISNDTEPTIIDEEIKGFIAKIQELLDCITEEFPEEDVMTMLNEIQDIDTAKKILNASFSFNIDDSTHYMSTMEYLAYNKRWDSIKHMVNLGYSIDSRNYNNDTPLHFASHRNDDGSDFMIEFLLNNGASPLLQNNDGLSVLHLIGNRDLDLVQKLINSSQAGNIQNIKSKEGLDPVQYIMSKNNNNYINVNQRSLICLIEKIYPNDNILNNQGMSLVNYASDSSCMEFLESTLMNSELKNKIINLTDSQNSKIFESWRELLVGSPNIANNLTPYMFLDLDRANEGAGIKQELYTNLQSYFKDPQEYIQSRTIDLNEKALSSAKKLIASKSPDMASLVNGCSEDIHKIPYLNISNQDGPQRRDIRNILSQAEPFINAIDNATPNNHSVKTMLLYNPKLINSKTYRGQSEDQSNIKKDSIINYVLDNKKTDAAIQIYQALTFLAINNEELTSKIESYLNANNIDPNSIKEESKQGNIQQNYLNLQREEVEKSPEPTQPANFRSFPRPSKKRRIDPDNLPTPNEEVQDASLPNPSNVNPLSFEQENEAGPDTQRQS